MKKQNNNRIISGKELLFNEKLHIYTYDGEKVPSVTTILQNVAKPVLVPWAVKLTSEYWLKETKAGRKDFAILYEEAKKVHRQKAADAANIGTNVHNYAEAFFKGNKLPKLNTPEAKQSVKAFHKWAKETKLKILAIERRIYSVKYGYAGSLDVVAEVKGLPAVLDYKTSKGIYPEMRFQTAAYQQALIEEKELEFGPRWIIRFDKETGQFEDKQFKNFKMDFLGFRGALNLHNAMKAIREEK